MQFPDAGLTEVLNRLVGLSLNTPLYVAVGTGTNAEDAADVALQTETVRVLASTVNVTANVLTIKAFLTTAQANATNAEDGLLTAVSGGTLLARGVILPAQAKDISQEAIVEVVATLERG